MIPRTLTGKILYILLTAIAACLLMAAVPARSASDKNYSECTGSEKSGHCVDKCPPLYHIQGYTDAGLPICSAPPTGCPYAERVPLGDACDKLAPFKVEPQPIKYWDMPEMEGK